MFFVGSETCSECCSNVRFQLTGPEAIQLTSAGTELVPVLPVIQPLDAEGLDHDIEGGQLLSWSDRDRMLAIGKEIRQATDPDKKEAWLQIARFAIQMRPGEGLFDMVGKCGNLQPDGSCADYVNRPRICREFEVDGMGCKALKTMAAVPVPVILTRKPV